MKNILGRLLREEAGQDLVEYALLVVLISLSVIAGMQSLANGISDTFSDAAVNMS
jgi:Flp pilus assembly pilin Flp